MKNGKENNRKMTSDKQWNVTKT